MLLLFVQVKYELGVAKRETVKREVIFEMQPIFLDYLAFTLLIINYLQTFSVGLRLHRAK